MAWNIKIIMAYYLGNYTDRSSDRGTSGLADQLTGMENVALILKFCMDRGNEDVPKECDWMEKTSGFHDSGCVFHPDCIYAGLYSPLWFGKSIWSRIVQNDGHRSGRD